MALVGRQAGEGGEQEEQHQYGGHVEPVGDAQAAAETGRVHPVVDGAREAAGEGVGDGVAVAAIDVCASSVSADSLLVNAPERLVLHPPRWGKSAEFRKGAGQEVTMLERAARPDREVMLGGCRGRRRGCCGGTINRLTWDRRGMLKAEERQRSKSRGTWNAARPNKSAFLIVAATGN